MATRRFSSRRSPSAPLQLEMLETRTMMSVVDVTTYGAVPNGGDAYRAITSAIRSAQVGDTIYFPSGTYSLSQPIILTGGLTFQGAAGAVLMATNGNYNAQLDTGNANNITIKGLTFNSGGLRVESAFGAVDNLDVEGCTFTAPNGVANRGDNNTMIYITSGTSNSLISGNNFINIANSGYGIFAYNLTTTRIVNNYFQHVTGDGIGYYAFDSSRGRNVVLSYNSFTDMPDKAIETGGPAVSSLDVSYNQIGGYVSGTLSDDTMALSIVHWSNDANYPTGTVTITHNTIVGPNYDVENGSGKPGVRIAIESAGDHTTVAYNSVCGTNVGEAIGYSILPETIHDNSFLGTNYASGIVYEGFSPLANIYNNDSSSTPNCTISLNPTPIAGPPSPGSGTGTSPTATQIPITDAPVLTTVTDGQGSIKLTWVDTTSNITGYLVERRLATESTFTQILDTANRTDGASATSLSFVDTGLPAGTFVYYRIRAYNATGADSPYSNISVTKTTGVKLSAYTPPAIVRAASTNSDTLAGLLDLVDGTSPFASN